MSEAFQQPSAQREIHQWRNVFANLSCGNTHEPFFANFGSQAAVENKGHEVSEQLVLDIAEQFAQDVFAELQDDLKTDLSRQSRTSKGVRKPPGRSRLDPSTPAVTPHRTTRNVVKMNRSGLFVPIVQRA